MDGEIRWFEKSDGTRVLQVRAVSWEHDEDPNEWRDVPVVRDGGLKRET